MTMSGHDGDMMECDDDMQPSPARKSSVDLIRKKDSLHFSEHHSPNTYFNINEEEDDDGDDGGRSVGRSNRLDKESGSNLDDGDDDGDDNADDIGDEKEKEDRRDISRTTTTTANNNNNNNSSSNDINSKKDLLSINDKVKNMSEKFFGNGKRVVSFHRGTENDSSRASTPTPEMEAFMNDDNTTALFEGLGDNPTQIIELESMPIRPTSAQNFMRRFLGDTISAPRRRSSIFKPHDANGDEGDEEKNGDEDEDADRNTLADSLSLEDLQRYKDAYAFVLDATHGRHVHGIVFVNKRGKAARLCFNIRSSRGYTVLFFLMVLLHMVDAYFEDRRYPFFWLVAAIPCMFYILDVGFKAKYMSWEGFISKRWNKIELGLTVVFLIDYFLLLANLSIPFRCLRPWIFLCKDKELRRFFQALIVVKWVILKIIFYIVAFTTFFATIAIYIFDTTYETYCESEGIVDLGGAFDNILIAFIHLVTLSSTENYPEVMMPVFREKWASFTFFCLFLVVSLFYILPVSLALINDVFWRAQGQQYKRDRKKERLTLLDAFNLLDVNKVGWITRDQWMEFMAVSLPSLSKSMHNAMFDILGNNTNVLGWKQFFNIQRVLKARFKAKHDVLRTVGAGQLKSQTKVKSVLDGKMWQFFIVFLILLLWVLTAIKWRELSDKVTSSIRIFQTIIMGVFVVDLWMKWYVRGWNFGNGAVVFKIPVHFLEIVLNLISTAFIVLYWTDLFSEGIAVASFTGCQVLRLAYLISGYLNFLKIFESILTLSSKLIFIILFTMFSFALITHEIYKDVPAFAPYYCAEDFDSNHCAIVTNSTLGNFGSLTCSSFVTFQIFTTSNWHEIMTQVYEQRSRWDAVPFILLYLLLQVVLMSLMIGTSIEAFFLVRDRQSKQNDANKKDGKGKGKGKGKDNKNNAEKGAQSKKNFWNSIKHATAFKSKSNGKKNSTVKSRKVVVESLEPTTEESLQDEATNVKRANRKTQQQLKLEQRKAARKRKRTGRLPSRCVAVKNDKKHHDNDLLLRKGDIVDILDQAGDRYKGRTGGRVGWFDAQCVLIVLDEMMINTLQQNSDVKYEINSTHLNMSGNEYDLEEMQEVTRGDLVDVTNMSQDELIEYSLYSNANIFNKSSSQKRKDQQQNTKPSDRKSITLMKKTPILMVPEEFSDDEAHDEISDHSGDISMRASPMALVEDSAKHLLMLPSKSAIKFEVLSSEDTSRASSAKRKVLFADDTKKIDGSKRDMDKHLLKEKQKKEGITPAWVQDLTQKKGLMLSEVSDVAQKPDEDKHFERPKTPGEAKSPRETSSTRLRSARKKEMRKKMMERQAKQRARNHTKSATENKQNVKSGRNSSESDNENSAAKEEFDVTALIDMEAMRLASSDM
eukprot:m.60486 g.60486  ORF g.60486 m.60486 type:complete len:1379 (+) comp7947_c0_seq2:28-4164(+)